MTVAAILTFAIAGPPLDALAQVHRPVGGKTQTREPERGRPKGKKLFSRPARKTAEEQLIYARELVAAGKTRRALKQLYALVAKWPLSPEAPTAQTYYAVLLEESGKYEKAFDELQYLVDRYPAQYNHAKVLSRQFAIANHLLHENRRFRGVSDLVLRRFFQQIIDNGPNWERAPECRFNIGFLLEKRKEYADAIHQYGLVLTKYPESDFIEDASFQSARCHYQLAKKKHNDEEAARMALSSAQYFLRQFPDSPMAANAAAQQEEMTQRLAKAVYERARYYDERTKRTEAAIIAYRELLANYPDSDYADEAKSRVDELTNGEESIPNEQ